MEFTWTVPADHPAFPGHFPARPIVPGVVLLDHALLLASQVWPSGLQLTNAKFLLPVGPGAELRFAFVATGKATVQFTVRAGDDNVAAGSFALRGAATP